MNSKAEGRSLFIPGRPQPQGSTTTYRRGVTTSANPHLKAWRLCVSWRLLQEFGRYDGEKDTPFSVSLTFCLRRPLSAPKSRTEPVVKPDLDKLVRAILDAGNRILWHDDSQVVFIAARKLYGDWEGVRISGGTGTRTTVKDEF